jgi:hypothetical protein
VCFLAYAKIRELQMSSKEEITIFWETDLTILIKVQQCTEIITQGKTAWVIKSSGVQMTKISVFFIEKGMNGLAEFINWLRLEDRRLGVRVAVGLKMFTFLYRPDRLWVPPSTLGIGKIESRPTESVDAATMKAIVISSVNTDLQIIIDRMTRSWTVV